jgi:hypothetical protein
MLLAADGGTVVERGECGGATHHRRREIEPSKVVPKLLWRLGRVR